MALSYDHWAGDDKIVKDLQLSLKDIKKEKNAMVRGQRCRRLKNKADKIQEQQKRDAIRKEIQDVEDGNI